MTCKRTSELETVSVARCAGRSNVITPSYVLAISKISGSSEDTSTSVTYFDCFAASMVQEINGFLHNSFLFFSGTPF